MYKPETLLFRGSRGVPRPSQRFNLSGVFCVCPRVSSQMDMSWNISSGKLLGGDVLARCPNHLSWLLSMLLYFYVPLGCLSSSPCLEGWVQRACRENSYPRLCTSCSISTPTNEQAPETWGPDLEWADHHFPAENHGLRLRVITAARLGGIALNEQLTRKK